jgi:hypothetical protein
MFCNPSQLSMSSFLRDDDMSEEFEFRRHKLGPRMSRSYSNTFLSIMGGYDSLLHKGK